MNRLTSREGKTWPSYVFGGRMRTSTLVLIIAFLGVGWLYETYEPGPAAPQQIPASEVVPPGFIPDPAYTWAPRTDVQRRSPTTTTTTTPTTSSTTPTSPTTPAGATETSAAPTPAEPTTSSAPSPSPAPSSSAPESPAPATPERPAAQSPTAAVPAGAPTPTSEPSTR